MGRGARRDLAVRRALRASGDARAGLASADPRGPRRASPAGRRRPGHLCPGRGRSRRRGRRRVEPNSSRAPWQL